MRRKPEVDEPEMDPDVEVKEEVDDRSYNMPLKVKLRHTKVRGQNKIQKQSVVGKVKGEKIQERYSHQTNYVKNKCKKKVN